jgi:hypothetical protein
VLSGGGICVALVTRLEESYRLWCVVVCDLEISRMKRPWPALGRSATKKESIPFIFNDESTGSCICLRLDLHMSHVKITCATAVCFCFYLNFPTPPTNRSHTCAYVTRMKDNVSRSFEPRYVIANTRISSSQCPRCDVNVTLGTRCYMRCARFPRSHEISWT